MPPNATHMTMSMITMQKQVHPAGGGGQIGSASAPPTSTAAPTNSSTVNSSITNQQQQVVVAGGQRTALKLSGRRPALHIQQQQQSVDVHHWAQQPAPLECSTMSGLTTSTSATATTTTTTTSNHAGLNERPPFDQQADHDQLDDPSECSCSDSFECSLNEQSLSTGSHLEKPLLGPQNRYESSAAHHNSNNNNNNHHHQQQQQLRLQPSLMQHEQRNIYNQHQQFPAQYHGKGRPNFERPHHNYYPAPLQHQHQHQHQQQPFYAGNQQQSQPPISATEHQRHHRPLVPHASMPLPMGTGANGHDSDRPCAGPHQSVVSSPAPLMRHSTYTATPETITDNSTPLHHADHRRQAYAHNNCENQTGRASPQPLSYSHYPAGSVSQSAEIQRRPRREIAFRRSATTRDDSPANRWPPGDQLQAAHNYQHETSNIMDTARTLPRERHHQEGHTSRNSLSTLQRPAKSRAAESQPQATARQQRINSQQRQQQSQSQPQSQRRNQRYRDGEAPKPTRILPAASDQTDLGAGCDAGGVSDLGALADGGCHMAGDSLAAMGSGFQASALDVGLFGAGISAGQLGFTQPFNSTAGVDFGATSAWQPVQRSLGAIPSHRTNSPWMRLSSIILTPVGIVIVLFIVVSPMLHYLM